MKLGDGRYVDPERLTRDGHLLDDRSEPCPKCGFQRESLPKWVSCGTKFVFDDVVWTILSVGSDNFRYRVHFEDVAFATSSIADRRVFYIEELRERGTWVP